MRKRTFRLLPGDVVTLICETNLWEKPFDEDPHAGVVASARKGSFGIVISAQENDRLVMFSSCFGWTNCNNLVQVSS